MSRRGDVNVFGYQVIAAGVILTIAVIAGLVLTRAGRDDEPPIWNGAVAPPIVLPVESRSPIEVASPTPSASISVTSAPGRRSTTPPRRTRPSTPPPPSRPATPAPGDRVSLEWTERPGTVMRHRNFLVRVDSTSRTSRQDATFTVRAGLARPDCLSLEAVNFRGRFVRHRDFVLRLDRRDDSELFRADATFCPEPARTGVVLRSVNYPDRLVTADRNGQLFLSLGTPDTAARFRLTPAAAS
jgi:hypothetical protein